MQGLLLYLCFIDSYFHPSSQVIKSIRFSLKACHSKALTWKCFLFTYWSRAPFFLTYCTRVGVWPHILRAYESSDVFPTEGRANLGVKLLKRKDEKNTEWFGAFSSLLWLPWRNCGLKAWMEPLCRLRLGPFTHRQSRLRLERCVKS